MSDVYRWDQLREKSGFWAAAVYCHGEFGVMWARRAGSLDDGLFIAEDKLPAAIEAAAESDPQTAEVLRFAQARIAKLRAVVEPQATGGRP
jgi:hypothetical protein